MRRQTHCLYDDHIACTLLVDGDLAGWPRPRALVEVPCFNLERRTQHSFDKGRSVAVIFELHICMCVSVRVRMHSTMLRRLSRGKIRQPRVFAGQTRTHTHTYTYTTMQDTWIPRKRCNSVRKTTLSAHTDRQSSHTAITTGCWFLSCTKEKGVSDPKGRIWRVIMSPSRPGMGFEFHLCTANMSSAVAGTFPFTCWVFYVIHLLRVLCMYMSQPCLLRARGLSERVRPSYSTANFSEMHQFTLIHTHTHRTLTPYTHSILTHRASWALF